jgi:hypothetical protein
MICRSLEEGGDGGLSRDVGCHSLGRAEDRKLQWDVAGVWLSAVSSLYPKESAKIGFLPREEEKTQGPEESQVFTTQTPTGNQEPFSEHPDWGCEVP